MLREFWWVAVFISVVKHIARVSQPSLAHLIYSQSLQYREVFVFEAAALIARIWGRWRWCFKSAPRFCSSSFLP